MKHTSGPWQVAEMLPDGTIISVTGTYEIRTPEYDVATWVPNGGPIRKLADAQLIAAAPDLLEACIAIHKADDERDIWGIMDEVNAAIKKATE